MEEHYQKKFIIEELDLEEASLDEIVQQKDAEFMGIEDLNIFYSYPYFSRDVYDFQFRLFTEGDELVLEDIKCNDTAEDEYQSVLVNSEVARVHIEKGMELIKNNCDLISGKPIEIDSDILVYEFENLSETEIKKVLVNNKNVVLLELYKNFY